MSSGGFGRDGKVYCKHMEEAAKRTSNTPIHPNRKFYCCKRRQSDPDKCDFWYWADQLAQPKDGIVHASTSLAASPSPPSSIGGTSTSSVAPLPVRQPREHTVLSSNSPETPRSKKRLEDIEAGLRQRRQDFSPVRQPSPSKEPGPSTTSFSGAQANIPQPPSPVPTEVDCEDEAQPRETFRSFLGLVYSPRPTTPALEDEGRPQTPKKRRLSPPATDGVIQPAGGLPPTPPQTRRRASQTSGSQPFPTTRNRKGKERECVPSVQTQDKDGSGWKAQEEDCLPLFTLAEDARSASSVSPTTADNVLDYADGMKERVKALWEYMDSFDVVQAAKLLQTIERQKMQYECRDQSQKARIRELMAERDKLAAEVTRLGGVIR